MFARKVDGKQAKKRMRFARPGERVYAYFRMRNRSGRKRCLHLTFRVNGKKRTEVTLEIGPSWNWRTWAYNTIHSSDRAGRMRLTVVDDQDKLVLDQSLPIVAAR